MAAFLGANKGGSVGASGVRSGEDHMSDVVVVEAGKDDSDFEDMMTAAEARESVFREKVHELLHGCLIGHTKVPGSLVKIIMQMAKHCATFEEPLRESDESCRKLRLSCTSPVALFKRLYVLL